MSGPRVSRADGNCVLTGGHCLLLALDTSEQWPPLVRPFENLLMAGRVYVRPARQATPTWPLLRTGAFPCPFPLFGPQIDSPRWPKLQPWGRPQSAATRELPASQRRPAGPIGLVWLASLPPVSTGKLVAHAGRTKAHALPAARARVSCSNLAQKEEKCRQ